MFEKLGALFSLFRVGSAVSDPKQWKMHQINANAIALVIMSLVGVAKSFGYDLPISDAAAVSMAGGLLTLVNVILTVTTSDKIGLPEKKDDLLLPASPDLPSPVPSMASDPVPAGLHNDTKPDVPTGGTGGVEDDYTKRPGWPFGHSD